MWKFVALLLLCVIAALASGAPQYFHERAHAQEDAAEIAEALAGHHPLPPLNHHSEQNCPVCAAFHAPLFSHNGALHTMIAGDWLPFVSMEPLSQQPSPIARIISCRGPPALAVVKLSA
ncbi:MAG TPA: hypothetical protein VH253_08710 [Phycisphaerae bacterium]|nr:hypothetical protein [Phycisphaerae bacterium]